MRGRSRFVLVADIAEFYQSLYTHSIGWALSGKDIVKQDPHGPHTGSTIDKAVRRAQWNQTNGIPVGPDTSFIVAELIMSAVDVELTEAIGPRPGVRYYDDYEIGFMHLNEAEHALHALESALHEYGLRLNSRKTRIHAVPLLQPEERTLWVRNAGKLRKRDELFEFFERAFDFRLQYRDSSIIAYAISHIGEQDFDDSTWPLVQDLLCQSIVADPSALSQFVRALVRQLAKGNVVDTERVRPMLEEILATVNGSSRGSDAAWILWAAIALDIHLGKRAAEGVCRSTDDVVALLALTARKRGLFDVAIDDSAWRRHMSSDGLWNEHWLLAYEANEHGLLPAVDGKDYVLADTFFSSMRENNVRFLKLPRRLTRPQADEAYEEMFPEHDSYG